MYVEVEGTAESLDQGHRAGLGLGAGAARLLDEMGLDGSVDDAQDPAHRLGTARE